MQKELIIAVLLGVGLSASTGFRVFIPMLIASIASYFDFLHLGAGFEWLGSVPAMVSLAIATVIEMVAYYIPVVDNLLDTIATPLAIAAGALLSVSVLPIDGEMNKWIMGIIVGGGSAGIVQSGTALTRLLSTKSTLTTGNAVVATGENVGAVTGAVLSLFFPILIGSLFLILFIFIVYRLIKWYRLKKKRKLYG